MSEGGKSRDCGVCLVGKMTNDRNRDPHARSDVTSKVGGHACNIMTSSF